MANNNPQTVEVFHFFDLNMPSCGMFFNGSFYDTTRVEYVDGLGLCPLGRQIDVEDGRIVSIGAEKRISGMVVPTKNALAPIGTFGWEAGAAPSFLMGDSGGVAFPRPWSGDDPVRRIQTVPWRAYGVRLALSLMPTDYQAGGGSHYWTGADYWGYTATIAQEGDAEPLYAETVAGAEFDTRTIAPPAASAPIRSGATATYTLEQRVENGVWGDRTPWSDGGLPGFTVWDGEYLCTRSVNADNDMTFLAVTRGGETQVLAAAAAGRAGSVGDAWTFPDFTPPAQGETCSMTLRITVEQHCKG